MSEAEKATVDAAGIQESAVRGLDVQIAQEPVYVLGWQRSSDADPFHRARVGGKELSWLAGSPSQRMRIPATLPQHVGGLSISVIVPW